MELYCLDLGKKLLFAWVGAWSLSNKSFSSITAYLVYWVIVTNTVVVFHNHIYIYIYIFIYTMEQRVKLDESFPTSN